MASISLLVNICIMQLQARSQPVLSGKPKGPFCPSCTSIFQNERNWMKKSARVSKKLVSRGYLSGLQAAMRLSWAASTCSFHDGSPIKCFSSNLKIN